MKIFLFILFITNFECFIGIENHERKLSISRSVLKDYLKKIRKLHFYLSRIPENFSSKSNL